MSQKPAIGQVQEEPVLMFWKEPGSDAVDAYALVLEMMERMEFFDGRVN